VHGEDLLIDDSSNGQAVEAVGECLPQLDVVSPLALVVESVDTVDGRALVVTAENEEILGVLDLVCEEQADGLEGLLATVDVVAKEEVVGLGGETAVLEQTEQIVVLAVDISADLHSRQRLVTREKRIVRHCAACTDLYGSLKLKQNGLGDEDLARLGAQVTDLCLQQLHLLAGPAAADFEKPIYDRVQVHLVFRHSCDLLLALC
jgi:hypothetical protein